MKVTQGTWLALGLVASVLAARNAQATALFASPPHFLTVRGHQQVVLFINEPLSGALASRTTNTSVEVVVPRAVVDPTLRGANFRGDEWEGATIQKLVLIESGRGNATIRLETSTPVASVRAYSVDDPPRLIIDLFATAQAAAPVPAPTPKAAPRRAEKPPAARRSLIVAAAPTSTYARPAPTAPVAAATPHPVPTTGPRDGGVGLPPMIARVGAALETRAPVDASPRPTATAAATAEAVELPCRFTRIAGIGFCPPDPHALSYAADPTLADTAAALAEGRVAPRAVPDATAPPGAFYLAADRAFVAAAPSGRLLGAVDDYRRALRRFPGFFDAPRARLNVVLAYRAMGFIAELTSAAAALARDPGAALGPALIGDLAFEQGAVATARQAYARAQAAGGSGPCLAARGRAALALAAGEDAQGRREVETLATLCPTTVLTDPETARVLARGRLAAGDAAGALAALTRLRGTLPSRSDATVVADIAAAAEAAGDVAAARRTYEELAAGRFGPRAASGATIALARLDAAGGNVSGGLERLKGLDPSAAAVARGALAREVLSAVLRSGSAEEVVALVHDYGVQPETLAADDQLRLAASYRHLGLFTEARALLRRLAGSGPLVSDAVWEERGALALAERDAPAALAVADEWLRSRGVEAPSAALALRARALAHLGGDGAALQVTARTVAARDPALGRLLRIALAETLAGREPAAALALVRDALAAADLPALEPADHATALAVLATAAEATGDDQSALEAFTTLAARYADRPEGRGAAYRAARLTAARDGRAAGAAFGEAAQSRDALERRAAAAAQAYETIVAPFENVRQEP